MYFKLPIEQHKQRSRPANQPWSASCWPEEYFVPTPNMSNIEDERYNAILANLDAHKASPPLVTPNTLARFLSFNPDHHAQLHESPRPKYKELIQNIKHLAVALDDRGVESDLLQVINDDKKINDYLGPSPSDEGDDDILDRISSIIAQLATSLSTKSHSKTPNSSSSSEPKASISALIPTAINVEKIPDKLSASNT